MAKKRQPGHIEAKPTFYKGNLFRSRLEARWAVFLDYHPNVVAWDYEPFMIQLSNGWEYTPDFSVELRQPPSWTLPFARNCVLLEIKPTPVSEEYGAVLDTFADSILYQLGIHLYLMAGDFYKMSFRTMHLVEKKYADFGLLFPRPAQALQIAAQHRFDLRSGAN